MSRRKNNDSDRKRNGGLADPPFLLKFFASWLRGKPESIVML
jgi:hypothetical protein